MNQSDSAPRAPRSPLCVEVNLESEHNFYTGFTENISSGGLFIATRDLLPLGVVTFVRFTLPNFDGIIEAECQVRWQRLEQASGSGISPGIGVHFLNLSVEHETAVNRFLAKRESLFFDDE
jgi:uncharacterized protein (TIGR02266 family)